LGEELDRRGGELELEREPDAVEPLADRVDLRPRLERRLNCRARAVTSSTASSGDSGGSRYSCSAPRPSRSQLVTIAEQPGAPARSSPIAGAASITCSKLSRTSNSSRPNRYVGRSSTGHPRPPQRERPLDHDIVRIDDIRQSRYQE
jgi:hypothetical protein